MDRVTMKREDLRKVLDVLNRSLMPLIESVLVQGGELDECITIVEKALGESR